MRGWGFLFVLYAATANAQTIPGQVTRLLNRPVQAANIVDFQLRQYLIKKAPSLPTPSNAAEWTTEVKRLRQRLLDLIFHGWPREWVDLPSKFEDLGVIPSGNGYRMRKLRYEIVPGFRSTAILYEPATVLGKAPAMLNVYGHYPAGKSEEFEQKRCINFAKMGIYALSLEWIWMGELRHPENLHTFGPHLELVGANVDGLFYLAMKRGLDYLDQHPYVDRSRLGMTGISGGAWQTMLLSGLDERVLVSIPVAGWSTVQSALEREDEVADSEYRPSDFYVGVDANTLVAMRAPKPTLLIYNAEDNIMPASLQKSYMFEPVRHFFRLFGQEGRFEWHENIDPGNHNYQLDNRLAAYHFVAKHFGLPSIKSEIPVGNEIKSFDELAVGLPKDNLTVLGVARKLADRIQRTPPPEQPAARAEWRNSQRARLKNVIRYQKAKTDRVWAFISTKRHELESRSYLFDFDTGLSATGVWLKVTYHPEHAPVTVVLNDGGKKASGVEVSDRLNRGEQVLAVDLIFTGDATPGGFLFGVGEPGSAPASQLHAQMLAAAGDRPLGMEVSQLIAIVRWLQQQRGSSRVRLESKGIRSQVISLSAAALEPDLFSEVVIRSGMPSLRYLLDTPVVFRRSADFGDRTAPELFCLDLYKEFDLDRLAEIANPVQVLNKESIK